MADRVAARVRVSSARPASPAGLDPCSAREGGSPPRGSRPGQLASAGAAVILRSASRSTNARLRAASAASSASSCRPAATRRSTVSWKTAWRASRYPILPASVRMRPRRPLMTSMLGAEEAEGFLRPALAAGHAREQVLRPPFHLGVPGLPRHRQRLGGLPRGAGEVVRADAHLRHRDEDVAGKRARPDLALDGEGLRVMRARLDEVVRRPRAAWPRPTRATPSPLRLPIARVSSSDWLQVGIARAGSPDSSHAEPRLPRRKPWPAPLVHRARHHERSLVVLDRPLGVAEEAVHVPGVQQRRHLAVLVPAALRGLRGRARSGRAPADTRRGSCR